MSEYSVVFAGEIVAGFDPVVVKRAAGVRLSATPAQLERLFCGRKAIIKKGVSAELGARYLMELRKQGMVVRLERVAGAASVAPGAAFRVVFHGEIIEGFDADAVAQTAAQHLQLAPAQLEQLFSGRKAVLKKGLSGERGWLFVAELARIGMRAALEPEVEVPAAAERAPEPIPDPVPLQVPPPPAFDPGATLVVGSEVMAQHLRPEVLDIPPAPPHFPHAFPVSVPPPPPRNALKAERMPSAPEQGDAPPVPHHVRCGNCGHKQPIRKRCVSCGFLLSPAVDTPLQRGDDAPRRKPLKPVPMSVSMGEPTVMDLGDPFSESPQTETRLPTRHEPARKLTWAVAVLLLVALLAAWWMSGIR